MVHNKSAAWNLIAIIVLSVGIQHVDCQLVLNEDVMKLANAGIDISGGPISSSDIYYDYQKAFRKDHNAAVLGHRDGRCFVTFPGTDLFKPLDVLQNFNTAKRDLCPPNESTCCQTLAGFLSAYDTVWRSELEEAIRSCVSDYCTYPNDDCLVVTGHSAGGAVAQVAAVLLHDLNPIVMTYANEASLNPDCPYVDATRWYRFVNTRTTFRGLVYDWWPFKATDYGLVNFGYTLVMTDDSSGVANLGLNSQENLRPVDPMFLIRTHNLESYFRDTGYRERIENLMAEGNYPIRTTGYASGFLCNRDIECASGSCARKRIFSRKRCT